MNLELGWVNFIVEKCCIWRGARVHYAVWKIAAWQVQSLLLDPETWVTCRVFFWFSLCVCTSFLPPSKYIMVGKSVKINCVTICVYGTLRWTGVLFTVVYSNLTQNVPRIVKGHWPKEQNAYWMWIKKLQKKIGKIICLVYIWISVTF